MTQKEALKLFEEKNVRTIWDDEHEKWYFSIVDVVAVLTDSIDPAAYWRKLKQRLKEEGNETVTTCHGLKMHAPDGKMRLTDVADTEQLFRIIQSIPSPKAEPFKMWMAQVASTRMDQLQDPELSIDQAVADYRRLGYSEAWINQRMRSIEIRKELTDEWQRGGVQQQRLIKPRAEAKLVLIMPRRIKGRLKTNNTPPLPTSSLKDGAASPPSSIRTFNLSREQRPSSLGLCRGGLKVG